MTVVYLDRVFLLNSVVDYLLFLCAARLCGFPLHRRRLIFCAVLGGVYAAAVFISELAFLAHPAIRLAFGGLLALAAFRRFRPASHFFCFRPPSPAPCWPSAWPLARWRDWHSGCITPMLAGKRLYWSVYCFTCFSGFLPVRQHVMEGENCCRSKYLSAEGYKPLPPCTTRVIH